MTTLIIVPLIACAGAAIDLANAFQMRNQLMAAADAAAVGAISDSSPALAQAQQMNDDGEVPIGPQDGGALFLAQHN